MEFADLMHDFLNHESYYIQRLRIRSHIQPHTKVDGIPIDLAKINKNGSVEVVPKTTALNYWGRWVDYANTLSTHPKYQDHLKILARANQIGWWSKRILIAHQRNYGEIWINWSRGGEKEGEVLKREFVWTNVGEIHDSDIFWKVEDAIVKAHRVLGFDSHFDGSYVTGRNR